MIATTLVLTGLLHIGWNGAAQPVTLAANDLAADCGRVLGTPALVVSSGPSEITLALDSTLPGPEAWRVVVTREGVRISGSDALGLVYGVYQFSERCLGVDPLWFWKDLPPERRPRVELRPQTFASTPAAFHFRGWFINDEDLLTDFGTSAGPRHADYPFYHRVIDPAMAERIYEGLLRLGGNLIIPASLMDVMNPPEAELVRRAVARGLYVTQHHIEPLGVSHFTYENYWRARGQTRTFRYSSEPDAVREVWRAYAQKWHELAGDQVIWQLGLRGRGDRPVWQADPGITPDTAGEYISRAMADQWAIVKSVDPRPQPTATTTLWSEGADLMAAGKLKFPAGLAVVFSDKGATQQLQDDFYHCPRLPAYSYGGYYHAAFWRNGPHLVQGVSPAAVHSFLAKLEEHGDTAYAIINVSNVREHALGAAVFIRTAWHGADYDLSKTIDEFVPPSVQPLLNAFHAALPFHPDGGLMQDGKCVSLVDTYLRNANLGEAKLRSALVGLAAEPAALEKAADQLDHLEQVADWTTIPARWQPFAREYFVTQGHFLAGLYRMSASLMRSPGEPAKLHEACEELEQALAARAPLATGSWAGWYAGDKKANWPDLLRRLREIPVAKKHL